MVGAQSESVWLSACSLTENKEYFNWVVANKEGLSRLYMLFAIRSKLSVVVFGAICSHCLQIIIFGIAHFFLRDTSRLGEFGGYFQGLFSSFLSFSTESYTSLGRGIGIRKGHFPLFCCAFLATPALQTGIIPSGAALLQGRSVPPS